MYARQGREVGRIFNVRFNCWMRALFQNRDSIEVLRLVKESYEIERWCICRFKEYKCNILAHLDQLAHIDIFRTKRDKINLRWRARWRGFTYNFPSNYGAKFLISRWTGIAKNRQRSCATLTHREMRQAISRPYDANWICIALLITVSNALIDTRVFERATRRARVHRRARARDYRLIIYAFSNLHTGG